MEVMIPIHSSTMEFDFTSAFTTPYSTAPSTPKRFGHFPHSTAPSSPSRASEFYHLHNQYSYDDDDEKNDEFGDEFYKSDEIESEKPKVDDGFEFEFSEELEKSSLPADELFDGGKIKSLADKSPSSPKLSILQGKKMIQNAFYPKLKKKQIDDHDHESFFVSDFKNTKTNTTIIDRGRDRERSQTLSNSNHRSTRSLSPYRVSEHLWEEQHNQQIQNTKQSPPNSNSSTKSQSSPSSFAALLSSSSWSKSKRWSLRGLLLFRSASEGRASDKDHLKKYSSLKSTPTLLL